MHFVQVESEAVKASFCNIVEILKVFLGKDNTESFGKWALEYLGVYVCFFFFCDTAEDESLMEVGLTHEPALLWIWLLRKSNLFFLNKEKKLDRMNKISLS